MAAQIIQAVKMMRTSDQTRIAIATVGIMLGMSSSRANAQVTVQQPVVQTFGVDTVVSIPDRGAILLGSVSGAGDARNSYGFGPGGSSIGNYRNHSSSWATAYIHDFEAMEAELLAGYKPLPTRQFRWSNEQAERAYHTLVNQSSTPPSPVVVHTVPRPGSGVIGAGVRRFGIDSPISIKSVPAPGVRVTGIQLLRDTAGDSAQ